MRTIVFVISAAFTLNVIKPPVALCQNVNSQRNECAISENLKPTKTVTGTYTEGAARKNVEGTVLLCVTVDGHGRVIDVSPLSGPAELLQLSMDAARKWQFEAPPEGPCVDQNRNALRTDKSVPGRKRVGCRGHRHDDSAHRRRKRAI